MFVGAPNLGFCIAMLLVERQVQMVFSGRICRFWIRDHTKSPLAWTIDCLNGRLWVVLSGVSGVLGCSLAGLGLF